MYRVLIVDDEPVICEGLKNTVPWRDYNCEVVATAGSGEEGLEVFRDQKVDILFSDIAMTNMDGLAMVAAIKSEYPDTEVTLLTGYRNFDYAQEAIRLGVTRFLLKPSKMNEIEEAIDCMVKNLQSHGNTGEEADVPDWDLRDPKQKFLYKTFIEEHMPLHISGASLFVVKKALIYIYDHYTEKVTLSDVAAECYVSTWHLSRLLNQSTGTGLLEIVSTIRIEKAKDLLKNEPGLRIQDIAERIGFLDVAHFSRSFKTATGVSPKDFRNAEV